MNNMATKGKKLNSIAQDEHDEVSYRKRVASWMDGNSVSYEDASFVSGDSPTVLPVATSLRIDNHEVNGHDGYFYNDGEGDIKVEISYNGTEYGGQHTIKPGEILILTGLNINKLRLTWVSDTSYRALIV